MLWLESVTFPDADEEFDFRLAEKRTCYNSMYPFFVLSQRSFSRIDFAPLTLLAGGNGCGKTTALNVIAEKLALRRSAPFNRSPFFGEYVKLCGCACRPLPEHAAVITSDDVFDFMLDARALNEGVEKRREALMREYLKLQDTPMRFRSLDEKYEPRLWRNLFGIFLLIFLAIRGYCFVIFTKIWRENLLAKGAKQSKAADVRLRRGEARGACSAARARASTKYERADSAFDRVRITPLQYSA